MRGKVARAIRRAGNYNVQEDKKQRKFVLVQTECFDVVWDKEKSEPVKQYRYFMMHNSELRARYKAVKKAYTRNRLL